MEDSTPAVDQLEPKPLPPPLPKPYSSQRDFLLHLEAYLTRRDGVDKLLKISRYVTKILLASSLSTSQRLKAFDSSVGASRKAFRLGKFVQDVNALRLLSPETQSPSRLALAALTYGGEGVYYFVEQFVWLVKAGLLPAEYGRRLQRISAWAELVGYVGSIALKVGEVRVLLVKLGDSSEEKDDEVVRKLREKLLLKQISIVQDLADGLMAMGDVRDGKGALTSPLLMASAGLLSAIISTHKNWSAC